MEQPAVCSDEHALIGVDAIRQVVKPSESHAGDRTDGMGGSPSFKANASKERRSVEDAPVFLGAWDANFHGRAVQVVVVHCLRFARGLPGCTFVVSRPPDWARVLLPVRKVETSYATRETQKLVLCGNRLQFVCRRVP